MAILHSVNVLMSFADCPISRGEGENSPKIFELGQQRWLELLSTLPKELGSSRIIKVLSF